MKRETFFAFFCVGVKKTSTATTTKGQRLPPRPPRSGEDLCRDRRGATITTKKDRRLWEVEFVAAAGAGHWPESAPMANGGETGKLVLVDSYQDRRHRSSGRVLITHITHAIAPRPDPPLPRTLRPFTPTERLLRTAGTNGLLETLLNTGWPPRQRGRFPVPPMRAWLTQPHGFRHKAPPQPCALTTDFC